MVSVFLLPLQPVPLCFAHLCAAFYGRVRAGAVCWLVKAHGARPRSNGGGTCTVIFRCDRDGPESLYQHMYKPIGAKRQRTNRYLCHVRLGIQPFACRFFARIWHGALLSGLFLKSCFQYPSLFLYDMNALPPAGAARNRSIGSCRRS